MMKKIFFLTNLFVLFMILSVNAQETTDTTSTEKMDPQAAVYYNNGVEQMKSGKFDEAVVSFDSSLQVTKDPRTYFMKGQALMQTKNLEEARKAFESSVALDSTFDSAVYALGNANLALKNYDAAITNYEQLKRVTKNQTLKEEADKSIAHAKETEAIEYYNKGNDLQKEGKFDEAIKNYDQALAINKNDYKTHYQKGLTFLKANRQKDAVSSFNTAIALNDSFDIGYMALASAHIQNKNYDEALKNYEKALSVTNNENLKGSIQEGMTTTYIILGNQYYKEKKYDKAVDTFKKATENADNDQAYLGLAKALIEKKQYDNALAALNKADELKKTVTEGAISYYKGVIYLNRGDNAKAIENFNAAAKEPAYKKAASAQVDYLKKVMSSKGKK